MSILICLSLDSLRSWLSDKDSNAKQFIWELQRPVLVEWSKWEREEKEGDRGHVTKPVTRRCWTWGKYRILSSFLSHLVPSLGRRELEIPQLSSVPSLIGWKLFQALGGKGAVWSQAWGRKMQILTLECWGLRDRSRGSWQPPPHGIHSKGIITWPSSATGLFVHYWK